MRYGYLVLILVIYFHLNSHAVTNLQIKKWKDASTIAQVFPNLLIKKNIENIGNLNLKELVQKINDKNEITFMSVIDFINKIPLGGKYENQKNDLDRIGAECYTAEAALSRFQDPINQIGSKRFVIINEDSPLYQDLAPYYLQFTLLHEALCSLYGFSVDDQYQITSSMAFLLGLLSEPDQLDKYLNKNKWNFLAPFQNIKPIAKNNVPKLLNQKMRRPAEDGGVTVGPGGGDPWAAYLKFMLMNVLRGSELHCEKQNVQELLNGLLCKNFLKKMQLFWDNLRQLNIETEESVFSINLLGEEIPSNRYRIRNNSDSSISLVFNRTYLKKIESDFKDKSPLKKVEIHMMIITKVFFDLIDLWSQENEKSK